MAIDTLQGRYWRYAKFNQYGFEFIKDGTLYFARPDTLNDDLETEKDYTNLLSLVLVHIKENEAFFKQALGEHWSKIEADLAMEEHGMIGGIFAQSLMSMHYVDQAYFCVSQNYKSDVMWSTYSDRNKSAEPPNIHLALIFEDVEYEDDWEKTIGQFVALTAKALVDAFEMGDRDYFFVVYRYFSHKLNFLKKADWSYEKESRIVLPINEMTGHTHQKHEFDKSELVDIIFGEKADEANIQEMMALLQKSQFSHVKTYKMARNTNKDLEPMEYPIKV